VAVDVPLAQLLSTLDAQVPGAIITGVNQNQEPTEPLADIVEIGFQLAGHGEHFVFRVPYADLHGGYAVVTMNAFVESLQRVWLLGTGLAPETVVPDPGSTGGSGPLPPGPVLP
jgi:hypothetical protein